MTADPLAGDPSSIRALAGRCTQVQRATSLVGIVVGLSLVALVGCARGAPEPAMARPQAVRAEAIRTLREAMRLSEQNWPGLPRPAVNECSSHGVQGVQFTFMVTVDDPTAPADFSRAVAQHWQRKGYTARVSVDRGEGAAGTIYDGTVRKADAPWLSYTAGDRRLLLYVDSQCADGDPHDFR
ncbi:hypothetical protein [Curtobacterium sp. MCBD17_003]|uniref:hypothetical protein n=1 Tax=Curtobacterium sp. MCBD17_003 TaxID=2175667 RepID=UPI000DA7AEA4|nr:hypothetical protein [Curtobacterium sp. MCBD17_003]WIE55643.1 hypothetical protein DEI88_005435 [Curtobacterium sp. MCBD17_003]